MPTTSNFGWTTPADTDLVKDGAAAIRTLGNGVDSSFVDLKGGTTDQVLAKNSNTDLDFKWVTSDDANAIQNAIVDAKGDIIAATAADTPARLAVGTNDQRLVAASGEATGLKYVSDTQNTVVDAKGDLIVGTAADTVARLAVGTNGYTLVADSSVSPTGLKWAAPSAGALTLINSTTFSGASSISLNNVFSATYANYFVATNFTSSGSTNQTLGMRLRVGGTDSTGLDYVHDGIRAYPTAVIYYGGTLSSFQLHSISSVNANNASHIFHLLSPNIADRTGIHAMGTGYDATYGTQGTFIGGSHGVQTAYDGFTLFVGSGNIAGTVRVYGYGN